MQKNVNGFQIYAKQLYNATWSSSKNVLTLLNVIFKNYNCTVHFNDALFYFISFKIKYWFDFKGYVFGLFPQNINRILG